MQKSKIINLVTYLTIYWGEKTEHLFFYILYLK